MNQTAPMRNMRFLWLDTETTGLVETVAQYFGIPMEKAHDALCDIRATRQIAHTLYRKGIKLF